MTAEAAREYLATYLPLATAVAAFEVRAADAVMGAKGWAGTCPPAGRAQMWLAAAAS